MKRTPLDRWLRRPGNSQVRLAAVTGLTQGSISKMLTTGRDIAVVEEEDQTYLVETKRIFGSRG